MTDTPTQDRSRLGLRGSHFRLQPLVVKLPLAVLVMGVVGQGLILLHLLGSSWFGTDDFNFLTERGPVPGHDDGLWRPYAGHWSTVPLMVYRLLFAALGMHSYLPYAGVVVVVHLANVVVMYALLRLLEVRQWPAVLTAWVLLFYGAGAETFMVAAAMNHTIPLLVALIACLVVVRTHGGTRGLRVAAGLGVVMVMCSATGLTALVFVGGVVGVRHGVRAAVEVVGPAVVAFAVWWLAYGRLGERASPHLGDLDQLPSFLWEGFTRAGGTGLGLTRLGGVLLLVAVGFVVSARLGPASLRGVAVVGALVALLQLTLVTIGDARLGSGIAGSGRYIYVVLFFMSPGIALVAQVGADRLRDLAPRMGPGPRRWPSVAMVLVLVVLVAAYTRMGVAREEDQRVINAGSAAVYRSWAYGSIAAADAGERQLSFKWGFLGAPFELLASPSLRSRMPAAPRDYRLDAEAQWFVVAGTEDPGMFRPTRPSYHGLSGSRAKAPGCHNLTTDGTGPVMIDVPSSSGTEIGVTSNSTELHTQLFRRYTPSPMRTWNVPPGPVYIATSAKEAILRVQFNGSGTFTVCHQ